MSQQYERIMVAVDGSYESELAFIKGVHVAKRNNAQLLLVHVSIHAPFKALRLSTLISMKN